MNFIELTQWNTTNETTPCLVNMGNVTSITSFERNWTWWPPLPEGGLKPGEKRESKSGKRLVTCICFNAGLHDESDSINVTETLAEILGKL